MSENSEREFGGAWTEQKLALVAKYLAAYTTALKKQPFRLLYIDGFAGPGRAGEDADSLLFADISDREPSGFMEGSAIKALGCGPPFDRYVFVEKSRRRIDGLREMIAERGFDERGLWFRQGDCNQMLPALCEEIDWRNWRAVAFLDPFGLQVEWETIRAIGATKAIDLWTLFPLAAINRMLANRPDRIQSGWPERLTKTFGTDEWQEAFYGRNPATLFPDKPKAEKTADFRRICDFYVKRLETAFAAVAKRPHWLYNRHSPQFALCFAVGNPRGQKLALRIARHLLKG